MSNYSKFKSHVLSHLSQVVRCTLPMLVVGLLAVPSFAQAADTDQTALRVNLTESGALAGRVVTMLDSEETPVVARVSLNADGKTVATSTTDIVGNFSFDDVKPGAYEMVGVSGEYVGGQAIVVGEAVEGGENSVELRVTTAATSTVAPIANAPLSAIAPVQAGSSCSTCAAPAASSCSSCNACSSCGGGIGGGGIGGGGSAFGGSSSLRRLLLLGTAVAIPVAIGASPDQASPDQ